VTALSRRTSTGWISQRRVGAVLLGLLTGLLAASAACVAEAQPPRTVPRIGVLWAYSPAVASPLAEALRQGLRELGYTEGQNLVLEERWAGREPDRLPTLAAELVRLNVDIIVTAATPAIQAAQHATKTIPIVMAFSNDPVESGFVASLARPGSNITGLSLVSPELSGRRLELLKAVSPKISRLAVLWNPSNPSNRLLLRETETAARVLGVQLQSLEARGAAELDSAFLAMTRARAGALVVLPDTLFRERQGELVRLAEKNGSRPYTGRESLQMLEVSWRTDLTFPTCSGAPPVS
jgi:putative tryptophan/tyrosine transport system substrate-binding protein